MNTTIILQGDDIRIWALMQALKQLDVFSVRYGSVTINFDGQGKISNIEKKTNHKVIELSTS